MEFTAFLGLFSGVLLILWAVMDQGALATYWDVASLRIVLGGTVAALAISHKGALLRRLPRLVLRVFGRSRMKAAQVRDSLVELAHKARKEGLLSLEDAIEDLEDDFMKDAVQLLADATPPEQIREILDNEIAHQSEHQSRGTALFRTAGTVAPAFGMIGTLIGLIQMLTDLDSPDHIGAGMAVALTTTLYGTLLANLLFIPMANKLDERDDEEVFLRRMIRDGILAIQEGLNPRFIEDKLNTYVTKEAKAKEATVERQPELEDERSQLASDD